LSLEDIRSRVESAVLSTDWDAVLRWESRIDELVAGQDQRTIYKVLQAFGFAYRSRNMFDKSGPMYVRCAEACGALNLFSNQMDMLGAAGEAFMEDGDFHNAALWYENARDVSKEHGFVPMESRYCSWLGHAFKKEGRYPDALEQYRRAWAVAQSVGENAASRDRAPLERHALGCLVEMLCSIDDVEEAAALFIRFRKGGDNSAACRLWNSFLRGLFHVCKRNFSDASLSFQAAVDVAETEPAVLKDLGAEYALMRANTHLKTFGVGAGDAPSLPDVVVMVEKASEVQDWSGVLRLESRMEELLTLNEAEIPRLIEMFADANINQGQDAKAASLLQRRVQVLEKMGRFSEQGVGMCRVGDCFLRLKNAERAETWYQRARKIGEEHGCYESECRACLGLGRVELFMHVRNEEAEVLLRNALTVFELLDNFVCGAGETLERDIKVDLAKAWMSTGRKEEAGPLIQRLHELAKRAGADPIETVEALLLAVRFQAGTAGVDQAWKEMQVLPSDPISHPPPHHPRTLDPTSHRRHKPQPAVADEILVLGTCSGTTPRISRGGSVCQTTVGGWSIPRG